MPCPICMEKLAARLIQALIGMRAEVIALRLQQVCRQPFAAVAVIVAQSGSKRRNGYAVLHSRCYKPFSSRFAPRPPFL